MSRPEVVGLDLSLTATGLAWPDKQTVTHGREGLSNPRVHIQERGQALMGFVWDLGSLAAYRTLGGAEPLDASTLERPTLVVMEGLDLHSMHSAGLAERIYVWWSLVNLFNRWGIPVLEVSPNTIKKYACGMGNANKREVVAGVREWFPDWEINKTGKRGNVLTTPDDNKADAVAAMAIGCELLGHPLVELPQKHRDALKSLELPPGVRQ